jgi:hypothetical protein
MDRTDKIIVSTMRVNLQGRPSARDVISLADFFLLELSLKSGLVRETDERLW